MSKQIRALGFTNSLQQLIWNGNNSTSVIAYLWGAGGGGGGNDSGSGGRGSGGGFTQHNFVVNSGDVIEVAVGGRGGAGASRQGSAAGGAGGASYISGVTGYYGGAGGSAGPVGSSGGGGGGGGATVLLLNDTVISAAGGGGGGGGGGNVGTRNGNNAPGNQGQSGTANNGGAGTTKTGDGGGGGGGGGGLLGGLGGNVRSGDQGAFAGASGSTSVPAQNSFDRVPGGQTNEYYNGTPGVGGNIASNGTAGYAVLEFDVRGMLIHHNGSFVAADTFVKVNNVWRPVTTTWIKSNGLWQPIVGSSAPEFVNISGNFGLPVKICIGVCDENDATSQSTMNSNWNTFLTRFPDSQLYCLQPGIGGMRVPPNFTSSGFGFGPILVNRDNGNANQASDWFSICNLGDALQGTVVQLSIDNSGSMTNSTVQASIDLLLAKCAQSGLSVQLRGMSRENWIAPFL